MDKALIKLALLVFAAFLWATPAHAISVVQRVTNDCTTGSVTSCVATITATGAGNSLIVALAYDVHPLAGTNADCTQTTSLADSGGDTFSNGVLGKSWVASYSAVICYVARATAGTTTVTGKWSATGGLYEITVYEVSGLAASPLDKTGSAQSTTGSGTSPTSGSVTTASPSEYLFCFSVSTSGSDTWSAATGGFTIRQQSGLHAELDQTVAAISTYTCGATISPADDYIMQIVTFSAQVLNSNKATPIISKVFGEN